MSIVICNECGKEISDTARSCPHCGAKGLKATGVNELQRSVGFIILIAGIIGLFIFIPNYITIGAISCSLMIIFGIYIIFAKSKKYKLK